METISKVIEKLQKIKDEYGDLGMMYFKEGAGEFHPFILSVEKVNITSKLLTNGDTLICVDQICDDYDEIDNVQNNSEIVIIRDDL